jgi:thioredoxin reductase (NADPH)
MAESCDVVIVGGGPAGLGAAVYTCRAELKTIILERTFVGGQVALTDDVENYPGFPEGIGGADLIQKMEAQCKRFGADIRSEEVTAITNGGDLKTVTTSKNEYRCPVVILATGADPRKLGVPGEEELRGKGVSYCGTCDGPFFKDRRVAVVGGGDAALKEALFITKFASELVLVHRRQGFRAEKIYQTQVREHPKISLELDCVVDAIVAGDDGKVSGAEIHNVQTDEKKTLPCDGVFIFIGNIPNTGFLSGLVNMDEGGHIETDRDMMTSVPGLFSVGDVRKYSYRQIATAVGEGATAAMAAEHWIAEHGGE